MHLVKKTPEVFRLYKHARGLVNTMTVKIFLPIGFLTLLSFYMVLYIHQESEVLTDELRDAAPGKFMELEAGKVHYVYEGADSLNLIVFIHGGGVIGTEVWEASKIYFLKHGYRVLAFDLYGRGYSERPDQDQSPLFFQKQLTQMIDGLCITEPFHLVAMSMGAIICLDYFHGQPERVRKMILIDPAISGNHRTHRILNVPVLSDIIMTVYWYPMSIQNQKKEFFEKEQFQRYSERVGYFMKFEGYKKTNYSTWTHLLNQNRMEILCEVDPGQILVIYGGQDPYFNKGQINLFRAGAPMVRMVKVDSAGHLPHYERPDQVNKLIHSFLEEGNCLQLR